MGLAVGDAAQDCLTEFVLSVDVRIRQNLTEFLRCLVSDLRFWKREKLESVESSQIL